MTVDQALDPRRWTALAVVCAAFFMTVLDIAIVNVALPSIAEDLEFAQSDLQWVVTAYAITFGGFLLLGGRAADLLGRRRVFLAGVVLFSVASLACGLATSDVMLVVSRAIQGLGAAIITPSALSIITTTFPEGPERNKALGVWGAVGGSGAAAGVLFGGMLTEWLGWEWIFFLNIPVGIAAFVLALRVVAESRESDLERIFDPLGAITVAAFLALLVYGISRAPEEGWASAATIGVLVLSVLFLIAFVAIERRVAAPLVPFGVFRLRTLTGANVVGFLLGATVFANFFVLTLYVQQVLGYSALRTGLTFLATAGTAVVVAGIAQAMVTRVGVKPVLVVGLALMAVAMLWYTQLPVDGDYVTDLLPGYLLVGIGLPTAFIPVSIAALAGIRAHEAGLASGLINTSQQIGGALGTALASTVFITRIDDLTAQGTEPAAAFTDGFTLAFWPILGFSVLALLATLLLVRRRDLAALPGHGPAPEVAPVEPIPVAPGYTGDR
jgi:EmrB/QacA subfamily drug resistance transporter